MKTLPSVVLTGAFALLLAGVAQAQTIPNPTDPTPRFPVATDGTPLPYHGSYDGDPAAGRGARAHVVTPFNALAGTSDPAVGVR